MTGKTKLKLKICESCGDCTPLDRTTCLNCKTREFNVYEIDANLINEIREV